MTGIRTWNITHKGVAFGDVFSDDTLYFGTGAIAPVATGTLTAGSSTDGNPDITHTPVTYADGSDYQGSSGTALQLWQNDFTHLDLPVDGGQTVYFAVDGTTSSYYWFNHASNAALSGSTQDGADGHWVAWAKSDLSTPNLCDSGAPTGVFCNRRLGQVERHQRAGLRVAGRDGQGRLQLRRSADARAGGRDGVPQPGRLRRLRRDPNGRGQDDNRNHGGNDHRGGPGNRHGGDHQGQNGHQGPAARRRLAPRRKRARVSALPPYSLTVLVTGR